MIAGDRISVGIIRWMLLLAPLGTGCATQVTPPAHVRDPVTVYLTDYGRHSSIVLPDPKGGFDEYAYGDYEWFALGHVSLWNGLRAAFDSPRATLGRRHLEGHNGTLTPTDFACERLTDFPASQARVEVLRIKLDAIFKRHGQPPVPSDFSGLQHVPDPQHYWLFHNCNHATARWLRDLGCKVDGPAILSNFMIVNQASTAAQGMQDR